VTADEAVAVFWRAVEAGHFADLEERLRLWTTGIEERHRLWTTGIDNGWKTTDEAAERKEVAALVRVRVAELLGLSVDSTWVDGLVAQGWAL
jgi:hypothetical protein